MDLSLVPLATASIDRHAKSIKSKMEHEKSTKSYYLFPPLFPSLSLAARAHESVECEEIGHLAPEKAPASACALLGRGPRIFSQVQGSTSASESPGAYVIRGDEWVYSSCSPCSFGRFVSFVLFCLSFFFSAVLAFGTRV